MNPRIKSLFKDTIEVKQRMLDDLELLKIIDEVVKITTKALQAGNKVLFCGNGGSAADAQHIACELSGRFYLDRAPLFAEALHVNTSALTSIGNDYGFEEIYARMVQSKGKEGDILFALSTSGNSPNVLRAVEKATELQMITIAMTGKTGGKIKNLCDHLIAIPSEDTPRIQECHIMVGHLICELVEKNIFGKS